VRANGGPAWSLVQIRQVFRVDMEKAGRGYKLFAADFEKILGPWNARDSLVARTYPRHLIIDWKIGGVNGRLRFRAT
jgi:hypothetical protein